MKKLSVRSTKGGICGHCGVGTQRRSHHHHTGHVETSGCGHATFVFRRAPGTAWTWWCILANKGSTNPGIVTKINSHLFPNRATTAKRRPAVLSIMRKCEWWGRRERAPVNFFLENACQLLKRWSIASPPPPAILHSFVNTLAPKWAHSLTFLV